jgi:hypothetical protein
MKFKGKVAYRGWSSGPAWGTDKEVALTLSNTAASTTFSNVTKSDLDNLIKDLKRIKKKLKEAPDKNAFG